MNLSHLGASGAPPRRPRSDSIARTLVVALGLMTLVLGSLGCVKSPAPPLGVMRLIPVVRSGETATEPPPTDVAVVEFSEKWLVLGAPESYVVSRAHESPDHLGCPGLMLEIHEADREALRAWTETQVGNQVAISVAGKVRAVATVVSPLPGHVMVTKDVTLDASRSCGFSKQELDEMLLAFEPDR